MSFFKHLLSVILGLFIFSIISTLIGFAFFSVIISSFSSDDKVEVKENSILHIKMDRPITEMESEDPFAEFGGPWFPPNSMGIVDFRKVIENAKEEENIKGILLELSWFAGGLASVEEIRLALEDFKESGKFIVAYGNYYSEAGYYLASVADEIYLNPQGGVELNGLAARLMFFKGMFEKLDIEVEIFRVGEFKSAVEPFMRKDMSDENRLQIKELLESVYTHVLTGVSTSRGLELASVRDISDNMLIRTPKDAVTLGMVKDLKYEDEVRDIIREKVGIEKEADLNTITYSKYKKKPGKFNRSKNEIAVIVATGQIMEGQNDTDVIGSDSFVKELRKARDNEKIKAIVLRINSPGGSFIASDIMWREIQVAKEHKPVIASMGDLAASGGYYLAMACDTIVAHPTTITGSIGIFGILPNMGKFFENKLGITSDGVSTGKYSEYFTVQRALTEDEKEIIQKDVERGYEIFTTKAAQGRNMEVDELLKIASGRVWSGLQGKENGLVDVIGSLNDAIAIAVIKAELEEDDFKVHYYPKPVPFIEQLLNPNPDAAMDAMLADEMGVEYLRQVRRLKNMRGVQALLPFELVIE